MPTTPPYSLEFRLEAVRLLRSSDRTIVQLAKELGCSPQSLRNWSTQIDVDEGKKPGLSSDEREELRRLRRRIGSGSAMDAYRFEQGTGVLLSRSGHGTKLLERRKQLQRIFRSLGQEDRRIARELMSDIQDALGGR